MLKVLQAQGAVVGRWEFLEGDGAESLQKGMPHSHRKNTCSSSSFLLQHSYKGIAKGRQIREGCRAMRNSSPLGAEEMGQVL